MALLAICAAFFLLLALGLREIQLARERSLLTKALHTMQKAHDVARQEARKASEDLYVMQHVLTERMIVDEGEFARARIRLIDGPRQQQLERSHVAQEQNVSPTQVMVLDDGESKLQ